MNLLTLTIDDYDFELLDYLLSLKGIYNVTKVDRELIITIEYDENIITPVLIFQEIALFLNNINKPFLLGFDKHFENPEKYNMVLGDVCCEYCYMGMIAELLSKPGIEKFNNDNFDVIKLSNASVDIYYDPSKLTLDDIKLILAEYIKKI